MCEVNSCSPFQSCIYNATLESALFMNSALELCMNSADSNALTTQQKNLKSDKFDRAHSVKYTVTGVKCTVIIQ